MQLNVSFPFGTAPCLVWTGVSFVTKVAGERFCSRLLGYDQLVFLRRNTLATRAILERLQDGQAAVVPALWWWETANVLLLGTRRGRLTPAQL
jgi:hypothetical protein